MLDRLVGRRVCVAGLGVAGLSAARALARLGARVIAVDRAEGERQQAAATELDPLGVEVRLGGSGELPVADLDLVVTSPGWRPDHPLLVSAQEAGLPVWGDVELAWRLRPNWQQWLGVTGTNGKTTTVAMAESILRAAGYRALACGNVGLPAVDAALDPDVDVLVVEMSSFQLHWAHTVDFLAAAILNIAPDHVDWHGSLAAYTAAKGKIWDRVMYAIYNADDPAVARLARLQHDSQDFSLGPPEGHCFGVDGDVLFDRCFGSSPGTPMRGDGVGGVELARVEDVFATAPHNVANALAAAALARGFGNGHGKALPPAAVRDGLRAFRPGGHRVADVATVDGVSYVDDSKATNPHAAAASLRAFADVVWVAGGLAKGARFDELVATVATRLRAVVLLGRDRALLADALARHAPEVPVVDVARTDTGAMDDVVGAAAALARPGDTVLLAPACASMDMFADYAERGDAFVASVRRLRRGDS